jgi:MFS family permease
LISGLLSMPLFLPALGVSNSNELGLILGSTLLGGIPGIFIAAWTADKFGRRFNLAFGGVIIIGGAIMQALVTGGWKLMGGKIILGFGSSFQSVAAGPYVAEVAHPRNRPQVTALINTFYYVGSVIAAWTTYGTLQGLSGDWTWRLPLLLQAAPSVITLALVLVVSESPRWLFSKGRTDEAHMVLAKYHANGKMDDEMVLHELAEIKEALELEKLATAVSYKTFTSTRGNKHRLAILIVSWLF